MALTKEQKRILNQTAEYVRDTSSKETIEEGVLSDLFQWIVKKLSPVQYNALIGVDNSDAHIIFLQKQQPNNSYKFDYVLLNFGDILNVLSNEYNSLLKKEGQAEAQFNSSIITNKIKEIALTAKWYPVKESYQDRLKPQEVNILGLNEAGVINAIERAVRVDELNNIVNFLARSLTSTFRVSFNSLKEVLPGFTPAVVAPNASSTASAPVNPTPNTVNAPPATSSTLPNQPASVQPASQPASQPAQTASVKIMQAFNTARSIDDLETALTSRGISVKFIKKDPNPISNQWLLTSKEDADLVIAQDGSRTIAIPVPGHVIEDGGTADLFSLPKGTSKRVRNGMVKEFPVMKISPPSLTGKPSLELETPGKLDTISASAPSIFPMKMKPSDAPKTTTTSIRKPLITSSDNPQAAPAPVTSGVDYSKLMLDAIQETKKQENTRFFKAN